MSRKPITTKMAEICKAGYAVWLEYDEDEGWYASAMSPGGGTRWDPAVEVEQCESETEALNDLYSAWKNIDA